MKEDQPKDMYDEAIEWLHKNQNEMYNAWNYPSSTPGGALFMACNASGDINARDSCGCLTQVRSGFHKAATDELTEAIRNDNRIPPSPKPMSDPNFTKQPFPLESLPVFAEWQRRLDKELRISKAK